MEEQDPAANRDGDEVIDEVAFEVPELTDEELDELALQLGEAEIEAGWDEDDFLVVAAADADRTERILEAVLFPDSLPIDDEVRDEASTDAISTWFVVADTLAKDPTRLAPVVELVGALEATSDDRVPFGLDGRYWATVRALADRVRHLVGDEASADEIRETAAALRNALRPVV
ncbi:MAG: hypothetical protein AAGA99_00280 [Actinomycetota bacterium]